MDCSLCSIPCKSLILNRAYSQENNRIAASEVTREGAGRDGSVSPISNASFTPAHGEGISWSILAAVCLTLGVASGSCCPTTVKVAGKCGAAHYAIRRLPGSSWEPAAQLNSLSSKKPDILSSSHYHITGRPVGQVSMLDGFEMRHLEEKASNFREGREFNPWVCA